MAFPTVQTADTQSGTVTSNSTSWTITHPSNLASGDLALMFIATDGNTVATTPNGGYDSGGAAVSGGAATLMMFSQISDGTESGTFTQTISASEQGAWRTFRITGWFGSGLASASLTAGANGNGVSYLGATGASSTPDPPSRNPANWDVEDTLWIAAIGVDTSRTISVFPLPDLQTSDVSGGAGGATLGICMQNDAVASKDPGTFTISASDDWVALTMAIRPAAVTFIEAPSISVQQAVKRSSYY